MPTEFLGFQFAGPLRPYQKTPQKVVGDSIKKPDYATHVQGISLEEYNDKRSNASIRLYSPKEIDGIREACRIGREVLDAAAAIIKAGVTCDEIDCVVSKFYIF